jgi:dipeptidyl aminopeptidase/acylaminoacyl peptidase
MLGGTMKNVFINYLLFISLFIFFGCEKSDYREVQQYTIEQFINTTTIFGSSFSFDEKNILFTSDKSGVYNVYSMSIDTKEVKQLTASDSNSIYSLSYFPNDNRFLYDSDKGGNEIWQIYLQNEDGTSKNLTPFGEARAVYYRWAFDEKSFFFGSNKRNPKYMDVYELDLETLNYTMIFQNDDGYSFGGISNDKQYLAFSKTITNHNSELYLYNFIAKEMKHLSPHEGDIDYSPAEFSVDSKKLYYTTNENSEFSYLKNYSIESGESKKIAESAWDIKYAYFSRNGKYRVIGINNDAKTEIKILNMETNNPVQLPQLPDADIKSVRISKNEKFMTFYVNGSKSPNNLYLYNFETNEYNKLTNSMNPEINIEDLVEAKVIRYKSFDGLDIPSILYKPQHIKPGEKAPALVWVHGGPGGQSRIGYSAKIQYYVNHGYVILAVNNRGSSGYGKTFFKLDDLKHGQDDLDDCVLAKKYFESLGYVDMSKIGIIGGSYGGYMVLAALAFRPDEFDVGVNIFGVANWLRTLKSIPPWWESFKEALYKELGNPETDEEYLRSISPLFHADNIIKPIIVLQGANDPRVLQVESDEMVEAIKKNNVPVEYVLFEDEGHGFRKKKNRIEGYRAILKFLDEYLKKRLN